MSLANKVHWLTGDKYESRVLGIFLFNNCYGKKTLRMCPTVRYGHIGKQETYNARLM